MFDLFIVTVFQYLYKELRDSCLKNCYMNKFYFISHLYSRTYQNIRASPKRVYNDIYLNKLQFQKKLRFSKYINTKNTMICKSEAYFIYETYELIETLNY